MSIDLPSVCCDLMLLKARLTMVSALDIGLSLAFSERDIFTCIHLWLWLAWSSCRAPRHAPCVGQVTDQEALQFYIHEQHLIASQIKCINQQTAIVVAKRMKCGRKCFFYKLHKKKKGKEPTQPIMAQTANLAISPLAHFTLGCQILRTT